MQPSGPKVHVIATGGTISSHFDGTDWTNLTGVELIDEVRPSLPPHLRDAVTVVDVASGPSSNLSVHDMVRIAERVRAALDHGATGVVVVHGTDTMELTAYVLQLVLGVNRDRRPVVLTGSMRVHSHPRPDGHTNLRDAVSLAASESAVGREVMVCLDGHIHAADVVRKVDASSTDAFTSAPFEPIGSVVDGAVRFRTEPVDRPVVAAFTDDVPLVSTYPGIEASVVAEALRGRRGAVVEGFGDLNVPMQVWGPIHEAWNAGCLVVVSSRAFTPSTARDGFDVLGAVGAGGLSAHKARLATMAALGTCADRDAAIEILRRLAVARPPHERSTT